MSSSTLPVELLIIVCCHAIYFGGPPGNPRNEETWALQPFQRSHGLKRGEHLTFLEHIEVAFDVARRSDTQAAVVFSGGCTNPNYANLSEARSYRDAASALKYDGWKQVLLEELATDSYQNLLFSILVFRKNFGLYPSHVKVVTHDFKSPRFRELHAKAVRWPVERFEVIGINPPFLEDELNRTIAAELRNCTLWEQDPYGVGLMLSSKREARRWNEHSLTDICTGHEEVASLLRWTGGARQNQMYPDIVPWNLSDEGHNRNESP